MATTENVVHGSATRIAIKYIIRGTIPHRRSEMAVAGVAEKRPHHAG
jgi:hypothetical protein